MMNRRLAFLGILFTLSCLWTASRVAGPSDVGSTGSARLFRQCRRAAEAGDPAAEAKLALWYMNGQGVAQDAAEAVKWFRRAAAAGRPDAQFNLALCCFAGRGVPQDINEALKWLHVAAEAGHAEARFSLGRLYAEGKHVPKDPAEAGKWYREAAESGCELVPFQSYSKRLDKKYFAWCVFVDPAYDNLNEIASIEYTLHPTFENPIRTVSDPTLRFALTAAAWGSFNIRILVTLKNGETRHQWFYLNLFGYQAPNQIASR